MTLPQSARCLHGFDSGGPRGAPARARVLKYNQGGPGPPLDFEFKACSLIGKCVISTTAELSRYHWETLCGPCAPLVRGLWNRKWYLEFTQLMRDLVRLQCFVVLRWYQEEVYTKEDIPFTSIGKGRGVAAWAKPHFCFFSYNRQKSIKTIYVTILTSPIQEQYEQMPHIYIYT